MNANNYWQERHHYTNTHYMQHTLTAVKERDKMKRDLAVQKGITLIEVPCWWDGKIER